MFVLPPISTYLFEKPFINTSLSCHHGNFKWKALVQATVKIPLISFPLVGKWPDSELRCGLIASLVHTHRSLLLQLFNINSFQISLTRWFIFTNNTHRTAFLLSSCLHPFTVRLTRQFHFRGTERQALSCRGCTDGPVTCLSYKQSSTKRLPTHSCVAIHTFHTKPSPWSLSCLQRQMCSEKPSTV